MMTSLSSSAPLMCFDKPASDLLRGITAHRCTTAPASPSWMVLNFLTTPSNYITPARCHVSHYAFELVQLLAKN
ncbi:hypothetical protein VZT92_023229 [Zoarces viviparus]|uniref:Uncharacterized protein n=1 Tax=Zoarces viviparus TaxID=48416 RepID=A0AAW1E6T7_ZOAVI